MSAKQIKVVFVEEEQRKELVKALRRAVNHLIMDGIHCSDAPEALAQSRTAIASEADTCGVTIALTQSIARAAIQKAEGGE